MTVSKGLSGGFPGIVIGWFLLFVSGVNAAAPADDKAPSLLKTPSEACQSCHKLIHEQWQKSAHGQPSTASLLYRALLRPDAGCDKCHAPLAKDQEHFANDGAVPCVVCHTLETFRHEAKGVGVELYSVNERVVQGPNGAWFGAKGAVPPGSGDEELASNPFFHHANPELFRTSVACQGCHDPQKKGDPKAYSVACQNCHMPVAGGFADHGTPAGKSLRMVKRGPILSLQAGREGKDLNIQVKLTNLLPHPFPNGGPFVVGVMRLTLLDARGEVLWENIEKKNMDQDPKALFALTVADDLGHPAPPRAVTTQPPKESRLKPGETRTLGYRLQQPSAALVRAEVIVLPLAPWWLDKLPEGNRELPKGLLAARSEVKLAGQ